MDFGRQAGQQLDRMDKWVGSGAYYRLVRSGPVEMEAALKAEHVVESVNGIQS